MTETRFIVNFKKLFGLICLLLRHKQRNPHTYNKERNVHNNVSWRKTFNETFYCTKTVFTDHWGVKTNVQAHISRRCLVDQRVGVTSVSPHIRKFSLKESELITKLLQRKTKEEVTRKAGWSSISQKKPQKTYILDTEKASHSIMSFLCKDTSGYKYLSCNDDGFRAEWGAQTSPPPLHRRDWVNQDSMFTSLMMYSDHVFFFKYHLTILN